MASLHWVFQKLEREGGTDFYTLKREKILPKNY